MIRSLLIIGMILTSATSLAQSYPGKPVRIIVPFEAGGPDSTARLVGQQLGVQTGRQFIVENRPGANGIIGADLVAKSPADGYTLMVTSTSLVVNPSVYKKLPFDTARDLAPVTNLASVEALILVVNNALPVRTLKELIALGKRSDARLAYGSPGNGNQLHIANELFNVRAGLKMVHVPYKGAGPAITALLSGELQVMLVTPPLSLPHIRAGKLRALAYTHNRRAAFMPEVPTMTEAGLKGFEIDGGWFALFAPANTPKDIVARLQSEARTALNNPQVNERLVALGLQPVGNSSAEFAAFFDAEIRKYAELVRVTGIQPE
jgi:tripartite-type tricarboxylate transporter receptor subunit TctC